MKSSLVVFLTSLFLLLFSEPHPWLSLQKVYPLSQIHPHEGSYFTSSDRHEIGEMDADKIVKVYDLKDSRGEMIFDQDKKALSFAQENHLPTVFPIEYTDQTIIMEKASGLSFDQILSEVAKNPKDEKRLCGAMKSIATSLGKLHTVDVPFSSPFKSYSDRTLLKDFINQKEALHLTYDPQKLIPYHLQLKSNHHPHRGLVHKDLHPGNIYINEDDSKSTFIDLTTLQTGDTTYDVALFLAHFEGVATYYGIDPILQKKGKESFIKEYKKQIPIHDEDLLYQDHLARMELVEDYAGIPVLSSWAKEHFTQKIS